MVKLEEALKKYNLSMPNPPGRGGIYEPAREFGPNFCYLSGCTPTFNGENRWTGKVGKELSLEQGRSGSLLRA